MNNLIVINIARFLGLVLLQVLVFNYMNIFGFINPLIYITAIFLFPLRKNITLFLIFSFTLGLSVDLFSDSGGINAAASVFIAFIRLPLLKAILRKTDIDYMLFNLKSISFLKLISFISISTIIHHTIVFSLAYFSFQEISSILTSTILTSIFSIITIYLGITLFTKKK